MTSELLRAKAIKAISLRCIDAADFLPDTTANLIYDSEYNQLPSDIFEGVLYTALNDLVDNFADQPNKFLQPYHWQQIDRIAHQYLNC